MLRVGLNTWSRAECWSPQSVSTCSEEEKPKRVNDRATKDDLVCAVDLGGTNLRAVNIDSCGRIHDRVRNATPASDPAEDVVASIAAAVRECEAAALKRGAQVQSVSVAVPGTVHIDTGLVVNAPNI